MDKKVADLINDQINAELFSSYLYLDFANYYHDEGLEGFANWFDIQAKEELDHAMFMRTYLFNNGYRVTFDSIEKPDKKCKKANDALKFSFEHEKQITNSIHKIYKAAKEADDFRTMEFLNWFVKEQGEEEKNADDLIKKFELYGKDAKGLYELNKELLARVYSAPSLTL